MNKKSFLFILTLATAIGSLSSSADHHKKKVIGSGSGAYYYKPALDWGQVPGSDGIGSTHGSITEVQDGRIFVPTDTDRGILVFGPKGDYQGFFGSEFKGIHHILSRVEEDGEYLYGAHLAKNQAIKLTLDGKVVWTLPYPKESGIYSKPNEYRPTAIAVGPKGEVIVTDGYGKNYVHIYTPDLKYVKSFGGRGKEDGKFTTPHGVGVDPRGEKPMIVVCDRENKRLQTFTMDGEHVETWATYLRRPCSISFHNDMAVVAELQGRVTVIDGNNHPVAFLGDNPENKYWANFRTDSKDWIPGIFTAPHGAAFDKKGNVLVMDWNFKGRITKMIKTPLVDN